jgi:hypothetical protein
MGAYTPGGGMQSMEGLKGADTPDDPMRAEFDDALRRVDREIEDIKGDLQNLRNKATTVQVVRQAHHRDAIDFARIGLEVDGYYRNRYDLVKRRQDTPTTDEDRGWEVDTKDPNGDWCRFQDPQTMPGYQGLGEFAVSKFWDHVKSDGDQNLAGCTKTQYAERVDAAVENWKARFEEERLKRYSAVTYKGRDEGDPLLIPRENHSAAEDALRWLWQKHNRIVSTPEIRVLKDDKAAIIRHKACPLKLVKTSDGGWRFEFYNLSNMYWGVGLNSVDPGMAGGNTGAPREGAQGSFYAEKLNGPEYVEDTVAVLVAITSYWELQMLRLFTFLERRAAIKAYAQNMFWPLESSSNKESKRDWFQRKLEKHNGALEKQGEQIDLREKERKQAYADSREQTLEDFARAQTDQQGVVDLHKKQVEQKTTEASDKKEWRDRLSNIRSLRRDIFALRGLGDAAYSNLVGKYETEMRKLTAVANFNRSSYAEVLQKTRSRKEDICEKEQQKKEELVQRVEEVKESMGSQEAPLGPKGRVDTFMETFMDKAMSSTQALANAIEPAREWTSGVPLPEPRRPLPSPNSVPAGLNLAADQVDDAEILRYQQAVDKSYYSEMDEEQAEKAVFNDEMVEEVVSRLSFIGQAGENQEGNEVEQTEQQPAPAASASVEQITAVGKLEIAKMCHDMGREIPKGLLKFCINLALEMAKSQNPVSAKSVEVDLLRYLEDHDKEVIDRVQCGSRIKKLREAGLMGKSPGTATCADWGLAQEAVYPYKAKELAREVKYWALAEEEYCEEMQLQNTVGGTDTVKRIREDLREIIEGETDKGYSLGKEHFCYNQNEHRRCQSAMENSTHCSWLLHSVSLDGTSESRQVDVSVPEGLQEELARLLAINGCGPRCITWFLADEVGRLCRAEFGVQHLFKDGEGSCVVGKTNAKNLVERVEKLHALLTECPALKPPSSTRECRHWVGKVEFDSHVGKMVFDQMCGANFPLRFPPQWEKDEKFQPLWEILSADPAGGIRVSSINPLIARMVSGYADMELDPRIGSHLQISERSDASLKSSSGDLKTTDQGDGADVAGGAVEDDVAHLVLSNPAEKNSTVILASSKSDFNRIWDMSISDYNQAKWDDEELPTRLHQLLDLSVMQLALAMRAYSVIGVELEELGADEAEMTQLRADLSGVQIASEMQPNRAVYEEISKRVFGFAKDLYDEAQRAGIDPLAFRVCRELVALERFESSMEGGSSPERPPGTGGYMFLGGEKEHPVKRGTQVVMELLSNMPARLDGHRPPVESPGHAEGTLPFSAQASPADPSASRLQTLHHHGYPLPVEFYTRQKDKVEDGTLGQGVAKFLLPGSVSLRNAGLDGENDESRFYLLLPFNTVKKGGKILCGPVPVEMDGNGVQWLKAWGGLIDEDELYKVVADRIFRYENDGEKEDDEGGADSVHQTGGESKEEPKPGNKESGEGGDKPQAKSQEQFQGKSSGGEQKKEDSANAATDDVAAAGGEKRERTGTGASEPAAKKSKSSGGEFRGEQGNAAAAKRVRTRTLFY